MGLKLCGLTGYIHVMACSESASASPLRAVQSARHLERVPVATGT